MIVDIADSLLGFKVAGVQGGQVFRVLPSGDLEINSIVSNLNTPFGGFGRYQNLLTYSESFDNAAWTKTNLTATANSVAAPDGQTTADTLTSTVADGYIRQSYNTGAAVTDRTFIFSVWLKAASATTSRLMIISSVDGSADGTTVVSETRPVTSDWQRFYIKGTFGTDTNDYVKARIVPVDGSTGAIYGWGAQLEEASDMGVYAYTTSSVVSTAGRGLLAKNANLSGNLTISGNVDSVDVSETTAMKNSALSVAMTVVDNTVSTQVIDQFRVTAARTLTRIDGYCQTAYTDNAVGDQGWIILYNLTDTADVVTCEFTSGVNAVSCSGLSNALVSTKDYQVRIRISDDATVGTATPPNDCNFTLHLKQY